MRVLREAYTEEDIRQRVADTRNIFGALIDSCYILASCFEDTEGDKETNDKLSRYASGYAREVKNLAADFEDDYEDFIGEKQEEEEIEEEPVEEEATEEEEVVEESLKEAHIKESRTVYEMRDDIDDLTDELDAVEGDRSECYITWNFGEDYDGNLTGGIDIHPHPRYEDDPEKIEELKAKVETIFRNHGFELDNAFKVNPGKTLFGAIHYQIKKSKDDFDGFFSNRDVTEELEDTLRTVDFGEIKIVPNDKITKFDKFIKNDSVDEWSYYQTANGDVVATKNESLNKNLKEASLPQAVSSFRKMLDNFKEKGKSAKSGDWSIKKEGSSDFKVYHKGEPVIDCVEGELKILGDRKKYSSIARMITNIYKDTHTAKKLEDIQESATMGSVEDFFKKMEGKSKAEVEKIVRQAKGNPNADKAYQKYLAAATKNSHLKESVDWDSDPDKMILDSYNHFTRDLGETPSVDDILEDIMNNYDQTYFKDDTPEEAERSYRGILSCLRDNRLEYIMDENLNEDTVKTSNGKWTNKGEEGTHGKFKTKKEADAQRRAIFANGYKEGLNEDYKKFTVDNQKFSSSIDPRTNTPYIRSIHPYDETEYHWARQAVDGKVWNVFRNGKRICNLNGPMTEEEVAQELLKLDKSANLKRSGGIW